MATLIWVNISSGNGLLHCLIKDKFAQFICRFIKYLSHFIPMDLAHAVPRSSVLENIMILIIEFPRYTWPQRGKTREFGRITSKFYSMENDKESIVLLVVHILDWSSLGRYKRKTFDQPITCTDFCPCGWITFHIIFTQVDYTLFCFGHVASMVVSCGQFNHIVPCCDTGTITSFT